MSDQPCCKHQTMKYFGWMLALFQNCKALDKCGRVSTETKLLNWVGEILFQRLGKYYDPGTHKNDKILSTR